MYDIDNIDDFLKVETGSKTWPVVQAHALAMEAELSKHRHKGDREGWQGVDPVILLAAVDKNLDELHEALKTGDKSLIKKCGIDACNFIMMVLDNEV